MNDTVTPSLTEEDYLEIFEIIGCLKRCVTLENLNQILENRLFPLIRVEMAGFVWSQKDFCDSKGAILGLINTVGMEDPDLDQACLLEVSPYHKHLAEFHSNTNLLVNAVDVDYSREVFKKELNEFLNDHPRFEKTRYAQANTAMALIDRPDCEIGMGLTRVHPNEERFTLHEVRIMELLHPCLLSTAKMIALNTEIRTYKTLIEMLSDVPAPFALTQEGGRVLFRNPAFRAIVPVEAGSLLPKPLREAIGQQKVSLNPDHPLETATPPMTFYQHGDTVYRLNLTQLHPEEDDSEPAWLLRLHTADDPYTALHRKLQQASLTPREVEVALLAGDGLDDVDIAQRLFISPNTLKNHLKSIYSKLDVHSRTQFMVRLHPQK